MNMNQSVVRANWYSGLFGCHGWGICCTTMFFPCITFGRNAHMIDEGKSSCCTQGCLYCLLSPMYCGCLYPCVYRAKLRKTYGLPALPCPDSCVHLLCHPCALCQEHAELKSRGLDPTEGWTGVAAPAPITMFK